MAIIVGRALYEGKLTVLEGSGSRSMLGVLVVLAAFALAAFTYLGVERLGRRALVPLVCRGIAWSALGLLLVNVSCPVAGTPLEPLVLLDASLSMDASGGRWNEARDSASEMGRAAVFRR